MCGGSWRTEWAMEADLCAWLDRAGCPTWRQVPILGRCADLVARWPDGALWAIEVKLRGPARGAAQAARYLLAADYALVALPQEPRNLAALKAHGLGLLVPDAGALARAGGAWRLAIPPRPSRRRFGPAAGWLQERIAARTPGLPTRGGRAMAD